MANHSPLAPLGAALDTDVSEGPGPASERPGAGPSLISPACQDAKLEDLEGLPVGRLRTARLLRRYPRSATPRKYRPVLLTCRTSGRSPAWSLVSPVLAGTGRAGSRSAGGPKKSLRGRPQAASPARRCCWGDIKAPAMPPCRGPSSGRQGLPAAEQAP